MTDSYIDFVRDLLVDFGPLRFRRIFGGVGVYSGELFFAILVDDTLYLKADEDSADESFVDEEIEYLQGKSDEFKLLIKPMLFDAVRSHICE